MTRNTSSVSVMALGTGLLLPVAAIASVRAVSLEKAGEGRSATTANVSATAAAPPSI
jgi:hypothetical protein